MAEDVKILLNNEDMVKAGVNFGHTVSKLHPKMKPYVTGIRNNVHLIDLDKTAKEFERALKFLVGLVREGKTILFVGTKIQMKHLVRAAAEEVRMPYVVERWLGGTFTNFETVLKRVDYYRDLEEKTKTGGLEKYTKKERLNFDKELQKLKIKFEGIKGMSKLPDAVMIFDLKKDETAAKEAKKKGIKIVGLIDTNIDPNVVDYAIPANDDALTSVQYILQKTVETLKNAK